MFALSTVFTTSSMVWRAKSIVVPIDGDKGDPTHVRITKRGAKLVGCFFGCWSESEKEKEKERERKKERAKTRKRARAIEREGEREGRGRTLYFQLLLVVIL